MLHHLCSDIGCNQTFHLLLLSVVEWEKKNFKTDWSFSGVEQQCSKRWVYGPGSAVRLSKGHHRPSEATAEKEGSGYAQRDARFHQPEDCYFHWADCHVTCEMAESLISCLSYVVCACSESPAAALYTSVCHCLHVGVIMRMNMWSRCYWTDWMSLPVGYFFKVFL